MKNRDFNTKETFLSFSQKMKLEQNKTYFGMLKIPNYRPSVDIDLYRLTENNFKAVSLLRKEILFIKGFFSYQTYKSCEFFFNERVNIVYTQATDFFKL